MLVDKAAATIVVDGGKASGGQYPVVIRNSTSAVQVPSEFLSSPASAMAVSAPAVPLADN